MKFITEMELRDLYQKEPFTTYALESSVKITPGARQFLVDRGIKLVQAQSNDGVSACLTRGKEDHALKSWCLQRLRHKMESLESLFLLMTAELVMSGDAILAEEVIELGKCFRNLKNAELQGIPSDPIKFWGWSEEEIKNCADNLVKLLEINEFHARLANGKTVTLLNYLRASLSELEPAILEAYWVEEQEACSRQDLIENVGVIINILCIMMWKCLGGQKCKP
ncbi:cobalamin adenosyltransferase [Desulfosporosinus sp. FKB]|uniref:cobalamin adenosyltransferase n=1 Tax=Desulfosporosinus sp. FKB TaxID=1969835 RepID=UPI000B49EA85|nr:cobalamin adenosyltransferase [Desulfosporosinus sp. FKB]